MIFNIAVWISIALATCCDCAHKVRYYKSLDLHRKANIDIFSILGIFPAEEDKEQARQEIYEAIAEIHPEGAANNDAVKFRNKYEEDFVGDAVNFPGRNDPPAFTTERTTTTTNRPRPQKFLTLRQQCQGRKGQFRYEQDCHKFLNCWTNSARLQSCFPKDLVFHPESGQCRFKTDPAVQGLCDSGPSYSMTSSSSSVSVSSSVSSSSSSVKRKTNFNAPDCSSFGHLGYECVPLSMCVDGMVQNVTDLLDDSYAIDVRSGIQNLKPRGKFSPWRKRCPRTRGMVEEPICCKNMDKEDGGVKTGTGDSVDG